MVASNADFVHKLAEALNEDPSSVHDETVLADLEGWDSVGQLSVIVLIDECFNQRVNVEALRKCRSVRDMLALIEPRTP